MIGSSFPVLRRGKGSPELWLVAGVHGDEYEGMVGVRAALDEIEPERGTIVGVPVAHVAAMEAGTRRGLDDVDLNRAFPGAADGSPTERLADQLFRAVSAGADALITFHSWHRCGSAAPYVEYAAGDARSADLARATGMPFIEPWDWPREASLNRLRRTKSREAPCLLPRSTKTRHRSNAI